MCPGVGSRPCRHGRCPVLGRHVLAHRVPLVAVDAALALLEVDRVGGQVPVDDGVAVGVEVETLLPDRGGRQDERPERRVEGGAHLLGAGTPPLAGSARLVGLLLAEAKRETGPHALVLDGHLPPSEARNSTPSAAVRRPRADRISLAISDTVWAAGLSMRPSESLRTWAYSSRVA